MRSTLFIWILVTFSSVSCKGQSEAKKDTAELSRYQIFSDSAKAYLKVRDTDQALMVHKQALSHARKHGFQEQEARTLMNIALLLKGQNAGQSISYLSSALKIAEGLGKQDLRADILMAISGVYKQQQNYRESLSALEAHQKLLQEVFKKNKKQEAERLRAEQYQDREHAVFLTILVSLAFLLLFFAFYYRRIQRLNKDLYKSNQIKDTLFSIIGHDLRGPASGIMQALEMVHTGLLEEKEEKEIISLLKRQSRSFNETLNTLLSWATAQLKGAQPQLVSVHLVNTLNLARDFLNAQSTTKDLKVNMPAYSGLCVLADRDQLEFIFRNLLSNAIKFSFAGGQIDVKLTQKAAHVIISIQDYGKGIPPSKLAELFAEGRLASTYGTNGEKGTGLGLMLSWDFSKANHGKIWCESIEGQGTTFYLSLPLIV